MSTSTNVRETERRIQQAETAGGPRADGAERADRRSGIVRGPCVADVRPAGAGVPDRPDARLHVHDVPRIQRAHLPEPRRHRSASHGLAHAEPARADRRAHQGQHLPRAVVRADSSSGCARRRTAMARCSITRRFCTAAEWATETSTRLLRCRSRSSAEAACRAGATSSRRRRRRCRICCWRWRIDSTWKRRVSASAPERSRCDRIARRDRGAGCIVASCCSRRYTPASRPPHLATSG